MNRKSRTSLVLMELIITILLFSFCSAVCVQLFVKAHTIGEQTKELNHSIAKAQGFAEVMRGTDGSFESIQAEYPNAVGDGNSYFQVYYDKDFNEIAPENADNSVYIADVTLDHVSKIQNMNIKLVRISDYEIIYSLDVTKYLQEKDLLNDK